MSRRQLRTAAWYGDEPLLVDFPDTWDVTAHWPGTPPPLRDEQIVQALDQPVAQPPIREIALGKSRPLIIVDDLTRPTPAARVFPFLLEELARAGIRQTDVSVLMATGSHGAPRPDAMAKKIGPEAAATCRVVIHDCDRGLAKAGHTSFGTEVLVNREVLASDLLIGIGGVFPQHSVGFGGGSKLAIGVLGKRSIANLHHGHESMTGSYNVENQFRRELDEVAKLIGLRTTINIHVDYNREVVRMVSGDHDQYYREAVEFAKLAYRAPLPDGADVVISNAYPIDVSLTFMRSKGIIPLLHAQSSASRILVASCPEGVGTHRLFPFIGRGPFSEKLRVARNIASRPQELPRKLGKRLSRRAGEMTKHRMINLYLVGGREDRVPSKIPGMTAVYSWPEVLRRIQQEQGAARRLVVALYPCAPLHVLDLDRSSNVAAEKV